MNDIISIKFIDKKHGDGVIITWGRVFKEQELLDVIAKGLKNRFGAKDIISIKLCDSLIEVSNYPYFYECLIPFIQAGSIPLGSKQYKKWVKKKSHALYNKNEMLFTGFKSRYQDYLERKAKGFPDDEEGI